MSEQFSRVLSQASVQGKRGRPPVHTWNPPFCGDIDIRIAADGQWYHEGRGFQRHALVELLASILKREGDEYFLVSPVEKVRIRVDDVPFVALRYRELRSEQGELLLEFETNVGDSVVLDAEHPLRVQVNPQTGEPRPYILARDGMEALLHRNVFYQLIEQAESESSAAGEVFFVRSAGQRFELGVV